jgi:hypothetical protein
VSIIQNAVGEHRLCFGEQLKERLDELTFEGGSSFQLPGNQKSVKNHTSIKKISQQIILIAIKIKKDTQQFQELVRRYRSRAWSDWLIFGKFAELEITSLTRVE